MANGTVTQSITRLGKDNVRLVLTLEVVAGTGGDINTYDNAAIDTAYIEALKNGWYLYEVECDPGATTPTDDQNVTLTDAGGMDTLGGAGAALIHSTTKKCCNPKNTAGAQRSYAVIGALTFGTATLTDASCTFTVNIIFVK